MANFEQYFNDLLKKKSASISLDPNIFMGV
jgi:hypothetical protein